MYACHECGRKFKTTVAAQRATINGCPKCNGTDIDLDEAGQREHEHDLARIRSRPGIGDGFYDIDTGVAEG